MSLLRLSRLARVSQVRRLAVTETGLQSPFENDADFEHKCDEVLQQLFTYLDDDVRDNGKFDCDFGGGVLEVQCDTAGWVINKQTPNHQIWLASPLSGPQRFEYFNGRWRNHRDHEKLLQELLEEEMSQHLGFDVEFEEPF
ncbi:MAG: hypothetical protein MHM6MM_006646 [Cercozoa sp. M6MM]